MNGSDFFDRPPIAEMAKRAAEAGGGLAAASKAVAIENYRASSTAHRQRVADSHAAGMKTLGFDVGNQLEADDMGDLIVTGDVYGDEAVRMINRGQSPPIAAGSTLSKWVMIAALLAGGGGVGAAATALLNRPEPSAVDDTDTQYEIGVGRFEPGAEP